MDCTMDCTMERTAQEMKLGVLGVWYHIFSSQGYIFFGTASTLHRMFQAHVTATRDCYT